MFNRSAEFVFGYVETAKDRAEKKKFSNRRLQIAPTETKALPNTAKTFLPIPTQKRDEPSEEVASFISI